MEITERARVLRAIIMILLFNSISICKTERKMCFKTCQDISKSKNSQTDTVRFQKKKKKISVSWTEFKCTSRWYQVLGAIQMAFAEERNC